MKVWACHVKNYQQSNRAHLARCRRLQLLRLLAQIGSVFFRSLPRKEGIALFFSQHFNVITQISYLFLLIIVPIIKQFYAPLRSRYNLAPMLLKKDLSSKASLVRPATDFASLIVAEIALEKFCLFMRKALSANEKADMTILINRL